MCSAIANCLLVGICVVTTSSNPVHYSDNLDQKLEVQSAETYDDDGYYGIQPRQVQLENLTTTTPGTTTNVTSSTTPANNNTTMPPPTNAPATDITTPTTATIATPPPVANATVPTTSNATTSQEASAMPTPTTTAAPTPEGTTTPPVASAPATSPTMATTTPVPSVTLPTGPTTTATPIPEPSSTLPSPATPPTTTTTRPAVGNCTLGDDILHVLLNKTTTTPGGYTIEYSVGLGGNREEILQALMTVTSQYSRQEIEACLDLYRVPPERPAGTPDSSAASNIIYQRPGHLGRLPSLPVPEPPSSNFAYGHGYTTYISPFNIRRTVPAYRPHPYLQANSVPELLSALAADFRREWDTWWQYGRPEFWFGRRPSRGN